MIASIRCVLLLLEVGSEAAHFSESVLHTPDRHSRALDSHLDLI